MLPKLSFLAGSVCVTLMFLTPSVGLPQEIPAAPPSGAQESDAATTASEFRYIAKAAAPDAIPESPSPARFRRDALHGQAYALWGSGLMGAAEVPVAGQFPLSQFGASVGGDVGTGRTAWFIAFDEFGRDPQHLLAAVAAAQARSAKSMLPANANVVTFSSFDARVDHRFSQRDSAYARLRAGDASSSLAIRGADGAPRLANGRRVTQVAVTAANTVDLSANTVNETHAQFISNEMQLPAWAAAGAVQSGLPTKHRDRVFEAANNLYRQIGGQSLRFGGDFLFNQMSISFLESTMGRIATSQSSLSQSSRDAGLYILSQRQVRPNLLLTSGVRYEIQSLKVLKTDTNNLAPQIGFAWSPSSRTVIRGGGAVYYDQVPLPAIPGSSDKANPTDLEGAARFTTRPGSAAGQMTLFTVFDPVIQNSYVESASLGIEQQLSAHTVVSSEYQFARGLQLAMPLFRSAFLCASPAACRAGRTFHAAERGTGAESSYQGFTVAFTQEPVRWGNYRIAYTRSSAEGSGTLSSGSYITDQLRRVSFTGVLHTSLNPPEHWWQGLERGYVLSGTADYSSRTEFTGVNFINLNARLTKTLAWHQHYRLDALAETLNSFERTNAAFGKSFANFSDRAANVFATYRAVASLQGPASAQLGLRVGF